VKDLATPQVWKTGVLAFWAINVGLAPMVLLSLLSVGLMQTWASVEHGTRYARSAEFMQRPIMDRLRWLRVIGDTIFAAGMVALGWFVLGLKTGWSLVPEADAVAREYPPGGSGPGPLSYEPADPQTC
jgi:nitric oxide reductase subunit B